MMHVDETITNENMNKILNISQKILHQNRKRH